MPPPSLADAKQKKPSLMRSLSKGFGSMAKALTAGGGELISDAAEDPGLSEKSLTQLIKTRYAAAAAGEQGLGLWGMYTFAGDVVVAVNPYDDCSPLYTEEVMGSFHAGAARGARGRPHIFGVAAKAHHEVGVKNQAIVINGESGAGKTETTKLLIKYCIRVASGGGGGGAAGGAVGERVSAMLLASSPVLEAFGNAKTIRNDNSSRFGKYVRLLMAAGDATAAAPAAHVLCGATVEKFLLEKSRVVSHAEGERSYHAFYYLLYGAPAALFGACKLEAKTRYRYLTPTGAAEPPEVDGTQREAFAAAFREVDAGLRELLASSGVPTAQLGERSAFYWRAIAGVLHLGQVDFKSGTSSGTSGAGCVVADPESFFCLDAAAELWGCDAQGRAALEAALVTRTVQLQGAVTETYPRDPKQARAQADALAKELYDRVFTALVHDVGGALDGQTASRPAPALTAGAVGRLGPAAPPHIGLLDIFGFEIFEAERNGFAQLLINYTNDKLQLYFTDFAVAGLTKFYAAEIPWRLRKVGEGGTDLTAVDGPVRAALLLVEGEEGDASALNIVDRLNDSALVSASGAETRPSAKALATQDKRFVDDLHTYFTGAKPQAGAAARARRAFVKKDGGAWDGEKEYRPRQEEVTATNWRVRKQLRTSDCHFAIQHFGALVPYNARDWVETNFDRLDKEIVAPLRNSALVAVKELFDAAWQPSPTRDRSISEKFRKEVSRGFLNEHGERERGSLLGSLRECTGHFIRCIKPNSSKLAWVFEPEIASSQLLACGVLAAALVNRTGYPDRPTFDGFLRKYRPAGLTPPGTAERRGSSRSLVKRNSAVLRASVALVQDLAKRPFPFGYGLRELSSNFSISSIEIEVSADHAQPLHRRLRMRHQPKESRPARQDQPVPEHDFCIGVERVFFSPGVLHRLATVEQPRLLRALELIVRLQCAARVMEARRKVKSAKFREEVAARKRAEAEKARLAAAADAAAKKVEFDKAVAAQLSAESGALLQKARAAAEAALEVQHRSLEQELREEIVQLKEAHAEALAAKEAEAKKEAAAREHEVGELHHSIDLAKEAASRAAEEAAEAHGKELESLRKSITAASQERERRVRVRHAEEVDTWRGLATQRQAVEQSMMEDLANETVGCVAEWRRLRKQQTLMGKIGIAGTQSKDGQAELASLLIKQGKDHATRARAGTMPSAAPLYHKARFFLRAGATLSRSFGYHVESIELRLVFKSLESYQNAEDECKQLVAENTKLMAAGVGAGRAQSVSMSFRPKAKSSAMPGGPADDDEFPLLEKPLSSSESKKLGQLLDQVGRLKDEALKAREASASKAEEAAASDRV